MFIKLIEAFEVVRKEASLTKNPEEQHIANTYINGFKVLEKLAIILKIEEADIRIKQLLEFSKKIRLSNNHNNLLPLLRRVENKLGNYFKNYQSNYSNYFILLPKEIKIKIIQFVFFMDKKSVQSLSCASQHLFWCASTITKQQKDHLSHIRRLVTELVKYKDNNYSMQCKKIMKLKFEAGIPNEGPTSQLHKLNLSNLDLSHLNLKNLRCKGVSFSNSNLGSCYLYEADLQNCDFSDTNFTNANLCKVIMNGRSVILEGANFKKANINHLAIEEEASYFSKTEQQWIGLGWGSPCKTPDEVRNRLKELGAIHVDDAIKKEEHHDPRWVADVFSQR